VKARGARRKRRVLSEKIFELFRGNVGGVENVFQRARFDDVMPGNNDEMLFIGHRDMFAFTQDVEADSFEGSHDALMRDLRELGYAPTSTVLNLLRRLRSSMLWR
jgi:hypothetical protein